MPPLNKLNQLSSRYCFVQDSLMKRVMSESSSKYPEYVPEPQLRDLPIRIENVPRLFLLFVIRLYQATLSRALPTDTCRFFPTCSHYGYQAIYKHGAVKGSLLAIWRVLRCNPFNPGGFDPVP
jgi:putative membrane protein insertion efficiency factor